MSPLYRYHCVECHESEPRVAGLDDHTALCIQCGSLMLRLNDDLFGPYFPQEKPHHETPCLAQHH